MLQYIQRDGIQHSLDMATRAKTEFLNAFESLILQPRNYDYKVQFTGPTGTNAVEAAVKLARRLKGRSHIVAFTNAYHGHTLGALALTGNAYYHHEMFGSHNNVTHLPFDGYLGEFNTMNLFRRMLEDRSSGLPLPAAVVIETVQGEGGVNVASTAWLQELSALCQEHDILTILDDIQVGNGRTGHFFSFEPAEIRPDLVCLSKAIGGGLPMSLVLIDRECDVWRPGQHTGTFRGNNLAFMAAAALLRKYWSDDQLMQCTRQHGELIESHLKNIAATNRSRRTRSRTRYGLGN